MPPPTPEQEALDRHRERILAWLKGVNAAEITPEEVSQILLDAVQDMIFRGQLDPAFEMAAVIYMLERFGSGPPDPDSPDEMILADLSYPILESPLLVAQDAVTRTGVNEAFLAEIPALENQVTHWQKVITAFPQTPFVVDPAGRDRGLYGAYLKRAINADEISPAVLDDQPEGTLQFLSDLRTLWLPRILDRHVPDDHELAPNRVGENFGTLLNEVEFSQPEGRNSPRITQSFEVYTRASTPPPDDADLASIARTIGEDTSNLRKAFNLALAKSGDGVRPSEVNKTIFTDDLALAESIFLNTLAATEDFGAAAQAAASFLRQRAGTAIQRTENLRNSELAEKLSTIGGAREFVDDFLEFLQGRQVGFEIPEEALAVMAGILQQQGRSHLAALADNPDYVVPDPLDAVRQIFNLPDVQAAITTLNQQEQAEKTLEQRVAEYQAIINQYNTPTKANARVSAWEAFNNFTLTPEERAAAAQALVAEAERFQAIINGWVATGIGSAETPQIAVNIITDFVKGPAGRFFAEEGAAVARAAEAAKAAAGFGSTELQTFMDETGIQLSTADRRRVINAVQEGGNIEAVLQGVIANRESFVEPFLRELASTNPSAFVRQHLINTGVITPQSSPSFLSNLQIRVIDPVAQALGIRVDQRAPLEDITGFVTQQIDTTARLSDLDEDEFTYRGRWDVRAAADARVAAGGPPVLPAINVLPSTQRARLSGDELFPAIAPLFETEEPEFLSFLQGRMGDLNRDFSFAAAPQVDRQQNEGLIQFARDMRGIAREVQRSAPSAFDTPAASRFRPFLDLTDEQIIGKATANVTTPGQTPQQFFEQRLGGLREEFETSPFGAQQRRRETEAAEAEEERVRQRSLRRRPTRFRRVPA